MLKPCFTISFLRENKFNPFDSAPLATMHLKNFVTSKRMALQNFLQNIEHGIAYSARNIVKTSFSHVTKFRNAGLPMVQSQNRLNLFLKIKGIEEQGLGHFFITSSCSYFFNKIIFKQNLFKVEVLLSFLFILFNLYYT